MSAKYRGPNEAAFYYPKQGGTSSNNKQSTTVAYIPKTIKTVKPDIKEGDNSKIHSQVDGPAEFDSFYKGSGQPRNKRNKAADSKQKVPMKSPKQDVNLSMDGSNPVITPLTSENGLKSLLGVKEISTITPKSLDETFLKSNLGINGEATTIKQFAETKVIHTTEEVQLSASIVSLDNSSSRHLEKLIQSSLNLSNQKNPLENEEVGVDFIEKFLEESLLHNPSENQVIKHEEQKIEAKNSKYQSNKMNVQICQEFYDLYSKKKNFGHLLTQLKECWEAGESTLEDEEETYKWLLNCHFAAIKSDNVFYALLFHLMIEKEYYELSLFIYQKNKNLLGSDPTFGIIISKAVNFLERKGYQAKMKKQKLKIKPTFDDRIKLMDLEIIPNSIHLIDRFERNGKRLRVPAFEKIGNSDRIAIHYEMNPYYRNYISVITIATKDEIVIIDLERLCKYDEVLLLIIEFFEVLLSRRATVVIMFDSRDLIEKLVHSLSIEDEHKMKDIIQAKIKLCQAVQKHRSYYTDFSLLGFESVRDMALKIFKQDIDQREKYGSWYRRPLLEDQLHLASIHVRLLYLSYDKLIAGDKD